mmetsp:Transcript_67699/g.218708  ORF Transcript_67699/g.218708 Transcript_67699/m.218708 type:complete len:200 (-) Transcript_67699:585-1184(-)
MLEEGLEGLRGAVVPDVPVRGLPAHGAVGLMIQDSCQTAKAKAVTTGQSHWSMQKPIADRALGNTLQARSPDCNSVVKCSIMNANTVRGMPLRLSTPPQCQQALILTEASVHSLSHKVWQRLPLDDGRLLPRVRRPLCDLHVLWTHPPCNAARQGHTCSPILPLEDYTCLTAAALGKCASEMHATPHRQCVRPEVLRSS